MDELIVNGKNVLKPVNLKENKGKIEKQRKDVPSQVTLRDFKEKVGIFRANVKGEDANNLVTEIQNCFTSIYQRETRIYDELDTIFHIIEETHKGSLEGIVYGVKTAQEAIKDAEYAIDTIEKTLEILQDFKTKLEENTEHLNDIDIIWDSTQELKRRYLEIEEYFSEKCNEYDNMFKDFINKSIEIEEIIKKNSIDITNNFKQYNESNKIYQKRFFEVEEYIKALKECEHLLDIDKEWQYSHILGKRVKSIEEKILKIDEMQLEVLYLKNKIKIAYGFIGGLGISIIVIVILNMLRII